MTVDETMTLRALQPNDNADMANIIRTVLQEFDADKPGFASQDAEMTDLYASYDSPGYGYWVIETRGRVVGGVGIAPLTPAMDGVCELRKMYLRPEHRGRGWGRAMLRHALEFAAQHYRWCYLESLDRMPGAIALYRSMGFIGLPAPLVATGHHGCDQWLLCELET